MKHIPLKTPSPGKKEYLERYPVRKDVSGRTSASKNATANIPNKSANAPSYESQSAESDAVHTSPSGTSEASFKPRKNKGSSSIPRGLTQHVLPRDLHNQYAIEVLRCLARFRIVRALDVAVYCFADRPYKSARQSARLALNGLLKKGCILRYKTEGKQTIHAMTERGKRLLESYGFTGTASIRRAANMVNPKHMMWLNFITLACEARGLQAFTESEIMRSINQGVAQVKDMKVRGVIKVVVESTADENGMAIGGTCTTVSLLPDAVALEEDGVTWFEIDSSRRGPARIARLVALLQKVGKPLHTLETAYSLPLEQSALKRISIHTTDAGYFVRLKNRLMREVRITERNILTESDNNLRVELLPLTTNRAAVPGADTTANVSIDEADELESYTFTIWRARNTTHGQEDGCVGHVILQRLPTGLPNYKGDDELKSNPAGWFEQNYLPYRRPDSMPRWPAPQSQFPLNLKKM
jgi:hypothetical protein